jgi:hypothetical protein
MAIDVFQEQVITLKEASKRLPKINDGKAPNVAAIHRWANRGVRRADKSVVRLETIKVGRVLCTSLEALQRFFDRLTGDKAVVSPPTLTQRQFDLQQDRIEEELFRRFGI